MTVEMDGMILEFFPRGIEAGVVERYDVVCAGIKKWLGEKAANWEKSKFGTIRKKFAGRDGMVYIVDYGQVYQYDYPTPSVRNPRTSLGILSSRGFSERHHLSEEYYLQEESDGTDTLSYSSTLFGEGVKWLDCRTFDPRDGESVAYRPKDQEDISIITRFEKLLEAIGQSEETSFKS